MKILKMNFLFSGLVEKTLFIIVIFSFVHCNADNMSILFEEKPKVPASISLEEPGAPPNTEYVTPFVIHLTGGREPHFKEFRYNLNGNAPVNCTSGTPAQTSTEIIIAGGTRILKAIACDKAGNFSNVTTRTYSLGASSLKLVNADVIFSNTSETQLMLTFSKDINAETAGSINNYAFDAKAYGTNIASAARQKDNWMALVRFVPGLSRGGHQINVRNVSDLSGSPIVINGIDNSLPFMISAPQGFDEGPVFIDPFNDGTEDALLVAYDDKVYLGTNNTSAKFFEMNYKMTSINTIIIDADGTDGEPVQNFKGYSSAYSGVVSGIDTIYSACIGGSSTPVMTGIDCLAAGGTEELFIGAYNTTGFFRSFWYTDDVSSISTTFTFTESANPDEGGKYAYRSTVFTIFKDQLWNHYGAENSGGGRGGRICMKTDGCDDGSSFLSGVSFMGFKYVNRIGAGAVNPLRNGSYPNNTYGGQVSAQDYVLNAVDILFEHDNDGTGPDESQLYVANGGFYDGALGSPRSVTSDGGVMRTQLSYSSSEDLPMDCDNDSTGCISGATPFWEDVTPDANKDWNSYMSIALPQNSVVTGPGNCKTSSIEMDCVEPYNTFTPSLKAIPYMRTAPNGDLYMLRNACSTTTVCLNGKADCDFRSAKQTCPPGSEVPQLWMMPKNCGNASSCASSWLLVSEFGASGKTNMSGNINDCGVNPNKCAENSHITLLEFVGNYLYIGFDNSSYGANVWRTDVSGISSGKAPSESSFNLVNDFGLDGSTTNIKIFSHITIDDSGRDWLIVSTRDGISPVKLYRTSNSTN